LVLLPAALIPSWHEEQVPVTCVWSTFVAGLQAVVAWHDSHDALVDRCVAPLPAALTPSWHDAQSLTIPEWVNVAGVQAAVVWQLSHPAVVGT
jgi:hypothetical protein